MEEALGRTQRIKCSPDGRFLLNIGCGPRTHGDWNNLDFSPYAILGPRPRLARVLRSLRLLSAERFENAMNVDPEIIHRDVRTGLGFPDDSFDVVFHSHFITHLERNVAVAVGRECRRVLKPGGVLRAVVPDLEVIVTKYQEAIAGLESGDPTAANSHREATEDLFELMVRRDPYGTSRQSRLVRFLELMLRGGVDKTGERRQWHYDRFSMKEMLENSGFQNCEVAGPDEGRIHGWADFHLDRNTDGSIHIPDSLYIEAW